MKKVYRNSEELSHVWAHKLAPEGSTPLRTPYGGGPAVRSAFFEGDFYYSYGDHYCAGRHLPEGYVAINTESRSVTTNAQVSELRRATAHLKQLAICHPDQLIGRVCTFTEADVQELLAKAAKAREKRQSYLLEASKRIEDFNVFARLLKSKLRIPVLNVEGWDAKAHAAALKAADEKRRKKADALRKKQEAEKAEDIASWRMGWSSYAPSGLAVMLRLNLAKDKVQTSRSAEIPVEDARKLWPIIERVRKGGKDYEVGMQLGHYRLTKIHKDGSITVGCHDISFAELEGIAHQLGLTDTSEAKRAWGKLVKTAEKVKAKKDAALKVKLPALQEQTA